MTVSAYSHKEDVALILQYHTAVLRMTGKELFIKIIRVKKIKIKIIRVNRGTSSAVTINSLPQLPLSFLLSKTVCIAWSSASLLELVKC